VGLRSVFGAGSWREREHEGGEDGNREKGREWGGKKSRLWDRSSFLRHSSWNHNFSGEEGRTEKGGRRWDKEKTTSDIIVQFVGI